jgi:DNA-binding beta-propeller fold protein YncE
MTDFTCCVFTALILVSGGAAGAQPADQPMKQQTGAPLPAAAIARLAVGKENKAPRTDPARVMYVAISPDSKFVATGENNIVRVFERTTGRAIRSFPPEPHQIVDLAFTPDGKSLLAAVAYHPARLWNLETGKETRSFKGAIGRVEGVFRVAFNSDASLLALAVPEPTIYLVKPGSGEIVRKFAANLVDRIAFSPDGRSLAGGGFNHALQLWDTATGKELWKSVNGTSIAAVAFSPDGKLIATGDYGSLVRLWNAQDGKLLRALPGVAGTVRTVAFSPDGRLIAAAGDGNDAVLYEAATGTELRLLAGHQGPIWSLAFSPDGQTLVTGSCDGTALVWDITGRKFVTMPAGPVTDASLEQLWTDMAKVEGQAGYQAVWKMIVLEKKVIPFLQERLRVTELPEAETVGKLIADLEDEDFVVREKGTKALAKLGKGVAGDLKKALSMNPSAEMKGRLEELLRPLLEAAGDPRLRALRALTVLEYVAAPEGRMLLTHLADKGPSEEVKREAAAALRRISRSSKQQ